MATERVPFRSTEATVTSYGGYVSVRGPGTGVLLSEGQQIHFEGDKRDAKAVGGKLVWLDGPVGGSVVECVQGGPCCEPHPRVFVGVVHPP